MDKTVEFTVQTDLAALAGVGIEANFEAVKGWLTEHLAPYRTLAVTGDNVRDARGYRAAVRKVKAEIEGGRKAVKASVMAPYTAFEARCRELTALCDEAAGALDRQIKAIEDAERREKFERLRAVFEAETTPEEWTYLSWDEVLRPAWGNKGYTIERAEADIRDTVSSLRHDLSAIRSVGGADTAYLLTSYAETHSLAATLDKLAALNRMRETERDAAARRPVDAPASPQEQREPDGNPDGLPSADAPTSAQETRVEATEGTGTEEARLTVRFEVICTARELAALGTYMRENGVRYRRITDD